MSQLHPLTRRSAIAAVLACASAALLPAGASAQAAWPNRPIKLIVPYAPGGGTDVIGRAVAARLATRLGQPVVVENRTGAGGTLGFDAGAKAPPDGYTLTFTTTAFATNTATGRKLPYDTIKDFTPIGQIGATPLLIVVAKDSKFKTLRELVDAARANPNGLNYGSSGSGSMSHLGMEFLASAAKVQFTHVPYKGMAPAFTDLMAGNVQATLGTFASASPLIDGGKLRGLAVTSPERSPFAPNIPTTAESGLQNFRIEFWWGLLAPANVPPAVAKRLNDELNAVLVQPEMRHLLAREAAVPTPGTPDDFGKLIALEVTRWTQLIKDNDIKTE